MNTVPFPVEIEYHATPRMDQRVLDAMMPYLTERFGNEASRNHSFGWEAEEGCDRAREQVATLIHAASVRDIVFTSGGRESNNLAIRGVAESYAEKGRHIITTVTEHRVVLDICRSLERLGYQVMSVPVDQYGCVDPEDVRKAIMDRTILITIAAANGEIGTLHRIADIGQVAKEHRVLFHVDGTQAVGKIPIDVQEMGIDLLSCTAHEMYGPPGIGALYVRSRNPRVRLTPLLDGGGQERGLRSGTLNVPGIVGLGTACELCGQELPEESARLVRLREILKDTIISHMTDVYLNGHPTQRLPGNLNLSFASVSREPLVNAIQDLATTSGVTSTSVTVSPSSALKALGVGEELAGASVRFHLGRLSTASEVEGLARLVIEKVIGLRALWKDGSY